MINTSPWVNGFVFKGLSYLKKEGPLQVTNFLIPRREGLSLVFHETASISIGMSEVEGVLYSNACRRRSLSEAALSLCTMSAALE